VLWLLYFPLKPLGKNDETSKYSSVVYFFCSSLYASLVCILHAVGFFNAPYLHWLEVFVGNVESDVLTAVAGGIDTLVAVVSTVSLFFVILRRYEEPGFGVKKTYVFLRRLCIFVSLGIVVTGWPCLCTLPFFCVALGNLVTWSFTDKSIWTRGALSGAMATYTGVHIFSVFELSLPSDISLISLPVGLTRMLGLRIEKGSARMTCEVVAIIAELLLYTALCAESHEMTVAQSRPNTVTPLIPVARLQRRESFVTQTSRGLQEALFWIRPHAYIFCLISLLATAFEIPSVLSSALLLILFIAILLRKGQFLVVYRFVGVYVLLLASAQFIFALPEFISQGPILNVLGLSRPVVPTAYLIVAFLPTLAFGFYGFVVRQTSIGERITHSHAVVAAQTGDKNVISRIIDEKNPVLAMRTENGDTLLHVSAGYGRSDIVQILLAYTQTSEPYFSINTQNFQGDTPLHVAMRYGYQEVVEMLVIAPGVNENLRNENKMNPVESSNQCYYRARRKLGSCLSSLTSMFLSNAEMLTLAFVYYVGMREVNVIHSLYLVLFLVFFSAPQLSQTLWLVVVIYSMFVLLVLYLASVFGYKWGAVVPYATGEDNLEHEGRWVFTALDPLWFDLFPYYMVLLFASLHHRAHRIARKQQESSPKPPDSARVAGSIRVTSYQFDEKRPLKGTDAQKKTENNQTIYMGWIWEHVVGLWMQYQGKTVWAISLLVAAFVSPSLASLGYILMVCIALLIQQTTSDPEFVLKNLWGLVVTYAATVLFVQYLFQYSMVSTIIRKFVGDAAAKDLGFQEYTSGSNLGVQLLPQTWVLFVCVVHLRALWGTAEQVHEPTPGSPEIESRRKKVLKTIIEILRSYSKYLLVFAVAALTLLTGRGAGLTDMGYIAIAMITHISDGGIRTWLPLGIYSTLCVTARYLAQFNCVSGSFSPTFLDWLGVKTPNRSSLLSICIDLLILSLASLQAYFHRLPPAEIETKERENPMEGYPAQGYMGEGHPPLAKFAKDVPKTAWERIQGICQELSRELSTSVGMYCLSIICIFRANVVSVALAAIIAAYIIYGALENQARQDIFRPIIYWAQRILILTILIQYAFMLYPFPWKQTSIQEPNEKLSAFWLLSGSRPSLLFADFCGFFFVSISFVEFGNSPNIIQPDEYTHWDISIVLGLERTLALAVAIICIMSTSLPTCGYLLFALWILITAGSEAYAKTRRFLWSAAQMYGFIVLCIEFSIRTRSYSGDVADEDWIGDPTVVWVMPGAAAVAIFYVLDLALVFLRSSIYRRMSKIADSETYRTSGMYAKLSTFIWETGVRQTSIRRHRSAQAVYAKLSNVNEKVLGDFKDEEVWPTPRHENFDVQKNRAKEIYLEKHKSLTIARERILQRFDDGSTVGSGYEPFNEEDQKVMNSDQDLHRTPDVYVVAVVLKPDQGLTTMSIPGEMLDMKILTNLSPDVDPLEDENYGIGPDKSTIWASDGFGAVFQVTFSHTNANPLPWPLERKITGRDIKEPTMNTSDIPFMPLEDKPLDKVGGYMYLSDWTRVALARNGVVSATMEFRGESFDVTRDIIAKVEKKGIITIRYAWIDALRRKCLSRIEKSMSSERKLDRKVEERSGRIYGIADPFSLHITYRNQGELQNVTIDENDKDGDKISIGNPGEVHPKRENCLTLPFRRLRASLRRFLLYFVDIAIWCEIPSPAPKRRSELSLLRSPPKKAKIDEGRIPRVIRTAWYEMSTRNDLYIAACALISRTKYICFIAIVLNIFPNPTYLGLCPLLAVLCYGILQYPRPPKMFWRLLLCYYAVVIMAKCLFQSPIFCASGIAEAYALAPHPDCLPATTFAFNFFGVYKQPSLYFTLWYLVPDFVMITLILIHRSLVMKRGLWGRNELEIHEAWPYKSKRREIGDEKRATSSNASSASQKTNIKNTKNNARSGVRERLRRAEDWFLSLIFGKRQKNLKNVAPGYDFFAIGMLFELLSAIIIILGYSSLNGQRKTIGQSLVSNQFSGEMVICFFAQLLFIVLDRVVFLLQSLVLKIILHYASITYWLMHILIFWPKTSSILFFNNGTLQFFLLIKIIGFLISGSQIYHGYPLGGSLRAFHQVPGVYNGMLFKAYRAIPFAFEMQSLLDWACNTTSLDVWESFTLDDIYASMYIVQCDIIYRKQRKRGTPQPYYRKLISGSFPFLALVLVLFGPMYLFSSANPVQVSNNVTTASLACKINGPLGSYSLFTVPTVANIRKVTDVEFARLAALGVVQSDDKQSSVQVVELTPFSDQLFDISPPALKQVIGTLNDTDTYPLMTLEASYAFTRPGPSDLRTIYGSRKLHLSKQERSKLAKLLTPRSGLQQVHFDDLLPRYLRLPATGDISIASRSYSGATLSLSEHSGPQYWSLCTNRMQNSPSTSSGTIQSPDSEKAQIGESEKNPASDKEEAYQYPGSDNESVPETKKSDKIEKGKQKSSNGTSSTDDQQCFGSQFWTVSNPLFPELGVASYSIIGLYVTVVLAVGRFVRLSFSGQLSRVIYEQLHEVDEIVDYCEVVYIARYSDQYELEEELYRKLILIFRKPSLLLKITRRRDKTATSARLRRLSIESGSPYHYTRKSRNLGDRKDKLQLPPPPSSAIRRRPRS